MEEVAVSIAILARGEQPGRAPARLVQADEALDRCAVERQVAQLHVALALGATELAADLVPGLLVQPSELSVPVVGEIDHGADVLELHAHHQAGQGRSVTQRSLEQVPCRVVVRQASQVHVVPGPAG